MKGLLLGVFYVPRPNGYLMILLGNEEQYLCSQFKWYQGLSHFQCIFNPTLACSEALQLLANTLL